MLQVLCALVVCVLVSACGGRIPSDPTGVQSGTTGPAPASASSAVTAPTVTMEEVRAQLEREEPNYAEAAQLGPGVLPHLLVLVRDDDPLLASKAAYLTTLIRDPRALAGVEVAARSPHPVVRVATAGGLRNLADVPEGLWDRMLRDPDVGVRQATLGSIAASRPAGVKGKVQDASRNDPDQDVRRLAREVVNQLP